jgi:hypothetical protein
MAWRVFRFKIIFHRFKNSLAYYNASVVAVNLKKIVGSAPGFAVPGLAGSYFPFELRFGLSLIACKRIYWLIGRLLFLQEKKVSDTVDGQRGMIGSIDPDCEVGDIVYQESILRNSVSAEKLFGTHFILKYWAKFHLNAMALIF